MDFKSLSIASLLERLLSQGTLARRPKASALELPSGSFLLGTRIAPGTDEPVYLSKQDRRKHLYILGSTGAGKSNLLVRLIAHDFSQANTALVLDLRGDLIDRLLLRLEADDEMLDRIRLVDLRQNAMVFQFNPLAGPGDYTSRALHVLGIIKKESESWGIQLEETLRHSLLLLCEVGGTLLDIERLLSDAGFRSSLLNRTDDPYLRRFFDRYGSMSPERQQSWSLPVLNKVSAFWTTPLVRKMLAAQRAPDWSDWIDQPGRLICIALAAHQLQSAGHLMGGLLISSLQNAIMARADSPESARNELTLYVDEFETMASPAFNSLIAEGRRFGASLVLAHQNLAQVDAGLRQTIRANVQTQIIFQCGSPDAAELANDVMVDAPRDEIRHELLQQRVGEAYLLRRGQYSIQVATALAPDRKRRSDRVAATKADLLQRTCVPSKALQPSVSVGKEGVRHVRRPKI